MPTMDQRMAMLEERVDALETAHERNVEFLAKRAVEHASKLDHLQADMAEVKSELAEVKSELVGVKADVKMVIARLDALPSIIAKTMSEALDERDRKRGH